MLRFIYTAWFLVSCFYTQAQSVVNGGFETWSIDSFGNDVPVNWYTDFSAAFSLHKDAEPFDGMYAARLMSRTPGIEGPYYGYVSTKVAAESTQGILSCEIAVDTVQHYQNDTAFALIQIDTTALYNGWETNPTTFGMQRIGSETNGFISVDVPFELPASIDSFYIHLVAKNITLPFTNLQMGYASFRADAVSISFVTSTKPFDNDMNVQLSPNPSTGIIEIKGFEFYETFSVYDVNGRLVQNGLVEPYINLSGVRAGMYRIVLQNKNGATVRRAVVVGLD